MSPESLAHGGVTRLAILSLTNLPVLLPAVWIMRQGLLLEGLVLATVAFASTMYHACDEEWPTECSASSFRVMKAFDESVARTAAVVGAALLGGAPRRLRRVAIVASLVGCACLQASPNGSDSSLVLAVSFAVMAGLGGLVYAIARSSLRFATGARCIALAHRLHLQRRKHGMPGAASKSATGSSNTASGGAADEGEEDTVSRLEDQLRASLHWWALLGESGHSEHDGSAVPGWELPRGEVGLGTGRIAGVTSVDDGVHPGEGADCCFPAGPQGRCCCMQQAGTATGTGTGIASRRASSSNGRRWNQDGKHAAHSSNADNGSRSLVHAPLPSSEPVGKSSSPRQQVSPPNGMARLRSSGGSPAMVPSMGREADLEMGTYIPAPSPLRGRSVAPAVGRQAEQAPVPGARAGPSCLGLCSLASCSLSQCARVLADAAGVRPLLWLPSACGSALGGELQLCLCPCVAMGCGGAGLRAGPEVWRRRVIVQALVLWGWWQDGDERGKRGCFWRWLGGDASTTKSTAGDMVREELGTGADGTSRGGISMAGWLQDMQLLAGDRDRQAGGVDNDRGPTVGAGCCGRLRALVAACLVLGYGCGHGRNVRWVGLLASVFLVVCGGIVFVYANASEDEQGRCGSVDAFAGCGGNEGGRVAGKEGWGAVSLEAWWQVARYPLLHGAWHLLVMWGLAGAVSRGWWGRRTGGGREVRMGSELVVGMDRHGVIGEEMQLARGLLRGMALDDE